VILKIKKLVIDAKLPIYAHHNDAGMDLFALEDMELPAQSRVGIPTGIAIEIPDEYVGLIWDKSGLASKNGISTLGGVVDSGYRGEIIVLVVNLSQQTWQIKKGEKVAQMLIQKIFHPAIQEVDVLGDSERGERGFGSTGK
jgi:dUTP pyrophosphatase